MSERDEWLSDPRVVKFHDAVKRAVIQLTPMEAERLKQAWYEFRDSVQPTPPPATGARWRPENPDYDPQVLPKDAPAAAVCAWCKNGMHGACEGCGCPACAGTGEAP